MLSKGFWRHDLETRRKSFFKTPTGSDRKKRATFCDAVTCKCNRDDFCLRNMRHAGLKKSDKVTPRPPPLTNGKEKQYATKHLSYEKKKTMNKIWEKLVKQNEINPNEVNCTKITKNYSQVVMCAKLVSYQDSSVYYECNTYTLDDWYRLCNTVVMWNFLI